MKGVLGSAVGNSQAIQALLVVLSATAGCTDIIGFLGLSGLVTAHPNDPDHIERATDQHQSLQGAEPRRRQRRDDHDRVDHALVDHPQNEEDRDERGQDQDRRAAE